jgi:hypothetical protein
MGAITKTCEALLQMQIGDAISGIPDSFCTSVKQLVLLRHHKSLCHALLTDEDHELVHTAFESLSHLECGAQ